MDDPTESQTHYADEDRDLQPICGGGKGGDKMTFFGSETTCKACLNLIGES